MGLLAIWGIVQNNAALGVTIINTFFAHFRVFRHADSEVDNTYPLNRIFLKHLVCRNSSNGKLFCSR